MSLLVFVLLYLSPRSWFACMSLWPIFSVACHLTLSSLRGGYSIVIILPWFHDSLVWAMYSVVDPIYKVIAVAGYLCISMRWIIYHIDTLGSCHLLPWWFSSYQQFLSDDRVCGFFMLQWCSSWSSCSYFLGHFSSWRLLQSFTRFLVISFWRGVLPTRFSPFSSVYRDCIVHGYLTWLCCQDPFCIQS